MSSSSGRENRVAEQMLEFLLTEISNYAAASCRSTEEENDDTNANNNNSDREAALTVSAEMAAAKLERMGAAVGYRFTEQLAESKTWNAGTSTQEAAARTAAQQRTLGVVGDILCECDCCCPCYACT